MPSKIEDYAIIGDLQTVRARRARRIDRLDVRAALRFAGLLRRAPRHARSRPLENRAGATSKSATCSAAIAATRSSSKPSSRPTTARCASSTSCRSARSVVDLVRIVEGIEGTVPMRMDLHIRFDYGSIVPWVRAIDGGIRAIAGPDTLLLPFRRSAARRRASRTVADFDVRAGERVTFDFTWMETYDPHPDAAKIRSSAERRRPSSGRSGRRAARTKVRGATRCMRSLITLKALHVRADWRARGRADDVAARADRRRAQLGLPVLLAARRHVLALRAHGRRLHRGGDGVARVARQRRGRATRRTADHVRPCAASGGSPSSSSTGFPDTKARSRCASATPRSSSIQLDVYGEVMDAMHVTARLGLSAERGCVARAARDHALPREGLEGTRRRNLGSARPAPPLHAFEGDGVGRVRSLRSPRSKRSAARARSNEWRTHRATRSARVIEKNGFDRELNAFVQSYGSDDPDASLLMLAGARLLAANDPRMHRHRRRSFAASSRPTASCTLSDAMPRSTACRPAKGRFSSARSGSPTSSRCRESDDEARGDLRAAARRSATTSASSPSSTTPRRAAILGNFPQAFSHVGLINTARNLHREGGPAEDRQATSK